MKKVLIIGAGVLQSFIIKKAKEMGYYTLALDYDPSAPGFEYADKYAVINIVDEKACLAFAKENKIDGVLTAATEYGVLTASYIAEKMNLVGLNYTAAQKTKNKYNVIQCFLANGVDDSDDQCFLVDADTDIAILAKKLRYPVIVKPCDGSGSRGTSRVDTPDSFPTACEFAMNASISHRAEVESFVEGKEYGAESLVVNGEVNVLAIMKKWMTKPPYYAELGHAVPCGLPIETEEKAKACVKKAIQALGINSGAVNVDMIITADGKVRIVDISARMGGNMIGPCIIPYGTGVDYLGAVIQTALGEAVDLSVRSHGAVATKILAFEGGIIKNLPDFAQIEKKYGVEIYHHMKVGDTVHEYHTNLDSCGYIVAKSENAETAEERAASALAEIRRSIFGDENT